MVIQIDTREQLYRKKHITDYFDANQIPYIKSKLYVGDYGNLDNPKVFVELKKDWLEFAGNAGKNHDRFKRELERLDAIGGKLYLVVEELAPLSKWKHKRSQMNGFTMLKILASWTQKHNIELVQCEKKNTGMVIADLLIFGR